MHSRIRTAGIVIKDDSVLLVERKRDEAHYFVFPGGGVEEGETFEETVVRELLEETSISVHVEKLLYHLTYDKPNPERSEQYFYLCTYVYGEPVLHAASIEQKKIDDGNGVYIPQWVPLARISTLELYPYQVRDQLMHDANDGFTAVAKEMLVDNY